MNLHRPETNFGKTKKLLKEFYKDESSKSLPNLDNLDFLELGKKFSILLIAINILNFAFSNNAKAEDLNSQKTNNKSIEWALRALENIDPIEYLLYKKTENKSNAGEISLEAEDLNILTWNLYREGRGENKIGKLGILLSVFERIKSISFPDSVKGVVFQNAQYSWTPNILKTTYKDEKKDVPAYLECAQITESVTRARNVGQIIKQLKEEITKESKGEIKALPEDLTHYQKQGMLDDPKYNGTYTESTIKRIFITEKLFESKDPRIVKMGTHIFYPTEITQEKFIEREIVKLDETSKKKLAKYLLQAKK